MAAKSARTLRPEDEISHYRIVGPLGVGGMGEVYLAQDQSLGRNVALKILPPDLVRSQERVRRFVLEAKSASSLSHPNIVTIHEIGRDAVRSASETDSSSVHFISMELVNGKTLSALIHEEHTNVRTLIGWLAQAADGIAKAHGAGIVHRDLKPGNIMVTGDGFAKVLDFGLAKLTERNDAEPDATNAPTVAHDHTSEGMVVGTVGYMSPEQVRGKGVDQRSDIFSFGCILYEAVTGRRAFAADSSVETMHKVLNDNPVPVDEVNPRVPAELRRLIRRCLHKNPEQRLQSMKDVALELREIESEYEVLSASTSSGSLSSAASVAAVTPKRASRLPWIVAGVVVLAAVALAAWSLRRGNPGTVAFEKMRMTTLTSSGDVVNAALSPDGRYLAYISEKAGRGSLIVRQVATGSDVVVVPPGEARLDFPSFSPDGNYLYYTAPRPDQQNYRTLYQVPSLGGRPSEIAFDVDSRASVSPDGKQLVFVRLASTPQPGRLIVVDIGTKRERTLGDVALPSELLGSPAWSPDGQRIAAAIGDTGPGLEATIALFDPRDGRRKDWLKLPLSIPSSVAWLRDGTALAISGQFLRTSVFRHVVVHPYPSGRPSRVTNDFSEYGNLTASLADETVAATRASRNTSIYIADADEPNVRRLTTATGPENSFLQATTLDTSTILSTSPRNGMLQLWVTGTGNGESRALTGTEAHAFRPFSAAGTIVFDRLDSAGIQVWAMNAGGGSARALTHSPRKQTVDLSRDGRHVLVEGDGRGRLSVIATADGRVERDLGSRPGRVAELSPDSRSVLVGRAEPDSQELERNLYEVLPIEGGAATAVVRPPANVTDVRWVPDGRSVTYIDLNDPGSNVFRSSFDGSAPSPVSHITDGRVVRHAWSPDGRRLGLLVRVGERVDLWATDAEGRKPIRLTQISPQVITSFRWMADSRRLVVEASTRPSDVVLIRNFR